MTEQQFDESVVTADRWSKVIALGVAVAVFLLARQVSGDVQFGSIVAAIAAIGARLYIPYHASMNVPASERTSLSAHPNTGNYHHGAAGLALVGASIVALVAFVVVHSFLTAVGVGVVCGILCYLTFKSLLPSE